MVHIKGNLLSWMLLVVVAMLGPLVEADLCSSLCSCKNIGENSHKLEVDCQHKSFTSVPDSLSPKTHLLKLTGNKITTLPAEAFSAIGLVNLKNVRLGFNNIQTVHKDAFKNLKKLDTLMLGYNEIHSLHPDTFKDNTKLEIITLSHNPIERLEDGLFANMPELTSVEVEHCNLTYIGPKTFENVPNLYYLYLTGNKLVNVDFATLFPLTSLRIILDKNPWKCDCHLKSLRDWMVKKELGSNAEWYEDHSPLCTEPSQLANKRWLDTKSEDFVCLPQNAGKA